MATRRTSTPAAQKAEAVAGDTVDFDFEGVSYTIEKDISLDVLDALSTINAAGDKKEQDYRTAMQCLLGLEQYASWRAKHSRLSELMALWQVAVNAVNAGK
ncbi:MAG TPA: hypothetical protein VGD55_01205 [Acidothermaceae bacterium]